MVFVKATRTLIPFGSLVRDLPFSSKLTLQTLRETTSTTHSLTPLGTFLAGLQVYWVNAGFVQVLLDGKKEKKRERAG